MSRSVARGNGHVRTTDIMNDSLDALHVKQYDVGGVSAGIPVVFVIDGSAGTGGTATLPTGFSYRVIRVWYVMTGAGGGSDTAKITDGTNDITDTLDVSSASDKDIKVAAQIDDEYHDVTGGLSLTLVVASSATCIAYIECLRT